MNKHSGLSQTLIFIDEMLIWSCAAATGYSILAPCMILSSSLASQSMQGLSVLHQLLLFSIVLACTISLSTCLIEFPNRRVAICGGLGCLFMVLSIQPAGNCCNLFGEWASGARQPSLSELSIHLLPVIGGLLLIISSQHSCRLRRGSAMRAKQSLKPARRASAKSSIYS